MPGDPHPEDPDSKPEVVDWPTAHGQEREALGLEAGKQPTALCLSGGGIRSAAFSLGVIQAFAEAKLLSHFNYLSTVSGGGYIGGWLTRLIGSRNDRKPESDTSPVSLAEIETTLSTVTNGIACDEIQALRRYTNYLTPRLGPASADLWAGVMLWVRNTLINWLVFTPLLIFVVSLPIAYRGLIAFVALPHTAPWLTPVMILAGLGIPGLVLYGLTIYRSIKDLPSHLHPWRSGECTRRSDYGPDDAKVLRTVVLPAILWCLIAPAAVAPMMNLTPDPPVERRAPASTSCPVGPTTVARIEPANVCGVTITVVPPTPEPTPGAPVRPSAPDPWWMPALFLVATIGVAMLAYLGGWLLARSFEYDGNRQNRTKQLDIFRYNAPAWLLASVVCAGLNGLGMWLGTGASVLWITILGPLWVLASEVLRSTLYVAFRTRALRGHLDREWLARLSGSKVSIVLTLAIVAVAVLVAPAYALAGAKSWLAVLTGGAASAAGAALFGKSARTAMTLQRADGTRWVSGGMLVSAAIVVFVVVLLMVIGHAVERGVASLASAILDGSRTFAGLDGGDDPDAIAGALGLAVGVVALRIAFTFGQSINLNHFSMHAVYRNRLVRAFLGTARPKGEWRPDNYTHFDPRDDLRMADAFSRREPPALFHVVNVALNCTSGKDLARAERKAESFTISPLHCGSASLNPQGDQGKAQLPLGAYAATGAYAGSEREAGPGDKERGISLGTAITISGAAASPNMGYHSSPLIAFVMTLFNVRLGAWLPNPGAVCDDLAFLKKSDADSIKPILSELAGRSDDTDRYVYLSDGGHFDNLALYEMLRRRCRFMVVVDAGQDEGYGYADLRIAIQNASIDLGVRMKFPDSLEIGQASLSPFGTIATVVYPKFTDRQGVVHDEEDGRILYLKPWLPKECPPELRAFKVLKQAFPHESTGNQFFTESDFESYRVLGNYIGRQALKAYRADDPTRRPLRPNETAMDRFLSVLPR